MLVFMWYLTVISRDLPISVETEGAWRVTVSRTIVIGETVSNMVSVTLGG